MVSKRRLGAVLLVLAALAGGLVAIGVLGAPAVEGLENTFGDVDEETTVIESDLIITNPNPFGMSAEELAINYSVNMNDVHMATGHVADVHIEPGNTTLPLVTGMNNERISDWWPAHVAADEVTHVEVDVTIRTDRFGQSIEYTHATSIETDILDGFRSEEVREVNAEHALADDPILYINETDAQWGEVRETETPIEKAFLVYNPNTEPYVLSRVGYEITMNDVTVGEGSSDREHVIPGHSHETVELTTAIDATALDEWWVTHLDDAIHGHQVTELRIEFWALVELPTGDEIEIELDALTYEDWIGTDMFEEGGVVGQPPADEHEDEAAQDDDSTADDQDATADGEEPEDDESTETDDTDDTEDENDAEDEDDGLLGDDDPL